MKYIWYFLAGIFGFMTFISLFPPYDIQTLFGLPIIALITYYFYSKAKSIGRSGEPHEIAEGEEVFLLVYKDRNENLTERKIVIRKEYRQWGFDYIKAVDVDLSEYRTFRRDRVIRLTNTATGEILV